MMAPRLAYLSHEWRRHNIGTSISVLCGAYSWDCGYITHRDGDTPSYTFGINLTCRERLVGLIQKKYQHASFTLIHRHDVDIAFSGTLWPHGGVYGD
jgi:hypothetical protein